MNDQNNNENQTILSTGPVLSSKWYERMKWFTLIFLPAFGSFYFGADKVIPALPFETEVVGLCSLFALFLGATLGVSSTNFKRQGSDGSINATVQGDQVVLSKLALPNIAPEELATKKSITIQVNPQQRPSQ